MRISLKVDYALRAMSQLAAEGDDAIRTAEHLATAQDIPVNSLIGVLNELKRGRLLRSHRGAVGGYSLSRPAKEIALADVIRVVEGPLADVHGESLTSLCYPGPASALVDVWMALRTSLRRVLEITSLADLAAGQLPRPVQKMVAEYRADARH